VLEVDWPVFPDFLDHGEKTIFADIAKTGLAKSLHLAIETVPTRQLPEIQVTLRRRISSRLLTRISPRQLESD